jgi:hypothetical protein
MRGIVIAKLFGLTLWGLYLGLGLSQTFAGSGAAAQPIAAPSR